MVREGKFVCNHGCLTFPKIKEYTADIHVCHLEGECGVLVDS